MLAILGMNQNLNLLAVKMDSDLGCFLDILVEGNLFGPAYPLNSILLAGIEPDGLWLTLGHGRSLFFVMVVNNEFFDSVPAEMLNGKGGLFQDDLRLTNGEKSIKMGDGRNYAVGTVDCNWIASPELFTAIGAQNMEYALITVEIPVNYWKSIAEIGGRIVDGVSDIDGHRMLSPTCVLLPLSNGAKPLRNVAAIAREYGLKTYTLLFDTEPDWLESSDKIL